jgi:hypothetical protein
MKRLRVAVVLTALGLLLLPAAAPAQSDAGHARFTPWSGYWWPHRRGGITRPLNRYGRYVGNFQALDWERQKHPAAGAGKWFGFCHAWSASAVMDPEPTRPRRVRTPGGGFVTLSVGDQKGLLAAMHAADPSHSYGQRSETNDPSRPEYIDLTPDQLWHYLALYVKQQGIPLIMDLEPGREVWNYPVYGYKVHYAGTGGSDYRGRITIWYAEDNVGPNFVGTKVGSRTYHCTFKMRGGTVVMGSGRWVGPSIRNHPDFAWYPYVRKPENPYVDVGQVRQMLGLGAASSAFRRDLGEPDVELPEPMTDPSRPPPPIALRGDPDAPPAEPTLPLAPGTITLTPADLITLVANKRSKFHLLVQTGDFNGVYKEGDAYKVAVLSEKPGHLYLFHLDRDGNVRLLFPMDGQDNRIPAGGKKVEFPGPKDTFKFVCDAVGDNRVIGVVASKPLNFTGLDRSGDDEAGARGGQGLPFFLNPQQEKEFQQWLGRDVLGNDDRRAEVAGEVKADPAEVLGDFAQGEVVFYVDRAPKAKP